MSDERDTPDQVEGPRSGMNRGEFLKRATAAEIALLAALGPAGVAEAANKVIRHAAASKPKQGGTLRIGVLGNGTSETYNPAVINSPIDSLHGYSAFDTLTRLGPNFNFAPGLAIDWVPNKTGTVWEIHLRKGVHWHDGKPSTADDVIYTLKQMGSTSHFGHYAVAAADVRHLSKLGDYIVKMPMLQPRAEIASLFSYFNTFIVQNGTKSFSKPIGTGPFKVQSFTPGQQATSVANRDYWDSPKPYVDELIVTSLTDPTTTADALQAGQFDAVYPILFPIAAAKQKAPSSSSWNLMVQKGGFAQTIYMRADQAPFNDVRVRQALKLIPNRQQMINVVLSGFGELGNDLFCKHLEFYDNSLPQHNQDLEKAKSLLKSAGRSDLTITLDTSEALPGLTDAAAFYAQEAAKIGVKVNVKTINPASYLNPALQYLKMPFAQDSWALVSLPHAYNLLATQGAPVNEGHYKDLTFDALVSKAESTLKSSSAQAYWNQAQQRFWQDSSYIVWGLRHSTSGMAANLHGWQSGWLLPLDDDRVWEWWFSS